MRRQPRLPGKQLPPVLMKIVAGDDHMGVQSVLADDRSGKQQIFTGVKGFFLGIDPLRRNAHGNQLAGGAAALGIRLIAAVQPAGGDAYRVGMGEKIRIGGFDASAQHHAGAAVIDLTTQQHHRLRRIRSVGGAIGGGKAHDGKNRQRHSQHNADAGGQNTLQPFGKTAEKVGKKATPRRQQQQCRRPEHADMAYANAQRHKEIGGAQQGKDAENG